MRKIFASSKYIAHIACVEVVNLLEYKDMNAQTELPVLPRGTIKKVALRIGEPYELVRRRIRDNQDPKYLKVVADVIREEKALRTRAVSELSEALAS